MAAPAHRPDFRPDPHLYPFAPHWFERDGVRMHYVDEGEGLPVVLLHGNPTWSFLYREVIRSLPQGMRALAPDYPGFGLSDHPPGYGYTPQEHARWIVSWLDRLELERFVLVVHDWGGPIGLAAASERPGHLAGLVIQNTWCWPPTAMLRAFSTLMGGRGPGRLLQRRLNAFARYVLPLATHRNLSRAEHRAYLAPFDAPDRREGTWVFPRAIRTSAPWLAVLEAGLGRLQHVPVELVWGMRDPAFGSRAVIQRWRRIFPDAGVTALDDASHYVAEDRPDAVAAAVAAVAGRARNIGLA